MAETQAQIQTFANQYAPYAQEAGNALGVSPDVLLAQWGLETGYGTQESGTNNLGNIGPGINYPSVQSFVNSFINLIQSNYPSAENTGTNYQAYVNGLSSGKNGSYFGTQSPSSYLSSLSGTGQTIASDASNIWTSLLGNNQTGTNVSNSGGTLTNSSSIAGNTDGNSTSGTGSTDGTNTSPCSGISAIFTFSCWQPILGNILLIGLGLLLALGAILVLSESHVIPALQTVGKVRKAAKAAFV